MKTGPKPKDYSGETFGLLFVIEFAYGDGRYRYFKCRCKCGKELVVRTDRFLRSRPSCRNCVNFGIARSRTHGGRSLPEYESWLNMRRRCFERSNARYSGYGGRGIAVCKRWLGKNGFTNFLSDMGRRPGAEYTIGRKNNDGNYEPSNCQWETKTEQARNRRSSRHIVVGGVKMTLAEAAEKHGLSIRQLWSRLNLGWGVERALSEPLRVRGVR